MPAAAALKVLVVDDQACMRMMIRRALLDFGVRAVRERAGAAEGIAALREERAHLIISDYTMPDMDGIAFLDAVRRDPVLGCTAFIMLTGTGAGAVVARAAQLGVNHYIVKPFATQTLREKICSVFGELT